MRTKSSPWLWVPTLYLIEGLPYAIVNTIALAIFKDMGVDNGTLGPLTTLISLPWLIKPLWSPFMDIFRSKRWWILLTQFTMLATLAVIAFCLPFCSMSLLMALFVIVAFASATHDISADGYYMLALDMQQQSSFVGIRNTFYRGGLVLGQGLLVGGGVGDDQDLGLDVSGVDGVGEGSGDETSGEGGCADCLGELPCGPLSVLPCRGDEDPLGVEACEEVCCCPDPLVGLLDVEDVETVLPDLVDEVLHVCALVLGSDVDTGGEVGLLRNKEFALNDLFLFHVCHFESS